MSKPVMLDVNSQSGSREDIDINGSLQDVEAGDLGEGRIIPSNNDDDYKSSTEKIGYRVNDEGVISPINDVDHGSLLSNGKSLENSLNRSRESNRRQPLWKHPRLRKMPKTVCAALLLVISGTGFLIGSFIEFASEGGSQTRGILFLIVALILGLPGIYQTVYIYRALKGRPGYNFSGIPSFDA